MTVTVPVILWKSDIHYTYTLYKRRWVVSTIMSPLSHQLPIWCAVGDKVVGSATILQCIYTYYVWLALRLHTVALYRQH